MPAKLTKVVIFKISGLGRRKAWRRFRCTCVANDARFGIVDRRRSLCYSMLVVAAPAMPLLPTALLFLYTLRCTKTEITTTTICTSNVLQDCTYVFSTLGYILLLPANVVGVKMTTTKTEKKKIIFSNLQRKNTTLITHERNKQAQCKPQKKNTNNNNSNKTRSAYIFVYNCMKNTISTTNRLIDYIRRVKRAEQRVMLTRPELNTV